MTTFAKRQAKFKPDMFQPFDKLQIVTIQQILDGDRINLPLMEEVTKNAQKAKKDDQPSFLTEQTAYLRNNCFQLTDEALHLRNEGFHLADETLYSGNEGVHLADEALYFGNEGVHQTNEGIYSANEAFHF